MKTNHLLLFAGATAAVLYGLKRDRGSAAQASAARDKYLDPDALLSQPTVRDLIPAYAWAWDRYDMTWDEFDAMPFNLHASRPPGFVEVPGAMYRGNTASYGETIGAWKVCRVKQTHCGPDGHNTQYEFLLIYIDGKPVIERFDDPYHDLSKKVAP